MFSDISYMNLTFFHQVIHPYYLNRIYWEYLVIPSFLILLSSGYLVFTSIHIRNTGEKENRRRLLHRVLSLFFIVLLVASCCTFILELSRVHEPTDITLVNLGLKSQVYPYYPCYYDRILPEKMGSSYDEWCSRDIACSSKRNQHDLEILRTSEHRNWYP